jgi:hypothetical protein
VILVDLRLGQAFSDITHAATIPLVILHENMIKITIQPFMKSIRRTREP